MKIIDIIKYSFSSFCFGIFEKKMFCNMYNLHNSYFVFVVNGVICVSFVNCIISGGRWWGLGVGGGAWWWWEAVGNHRRPQSPVPAHS